MSKYYLDQDKLYAMILKRRRSYNRYVNLSALVGLMLAFRNSTYRLQGLVPNGLPKKGR